ncbi:Putative tyrosine-protein kinase in cps region [Campylobacter jejuni]|nr:Putative tyrosine-protein kinase in cps region [Campylobacter jejuni]
MSYVTNKSVNIDSDEINLDRIIGELIDNRKLILLVTAIFTIVAILYALLVTPIYQSDALIQVEQKQGNALLSSLSQVLPDSQTPSAPEIALLQSRMILGKTVDDLNLQANVEQNYFPVVGRGWSRMIGNKPGAISVSHLYLSQKYGTDVPQITLKVRDERHFDIETDNGVLSGEVGVLLEKDGLALKIDKLNAKPGTTFTISYLTRLNAITNLQEVFTVADQAKDTGMLTLSITGEDPVYISKILDSISNNYLEQNIARQAAQDAKSLDFLDKQLPIVRSELDVAEGKLNQYRQQQNSVDLSLEAKSVLDQIVNVDNQLNGLTFRESEISQLFTKEHPTYKALIEKRQTLQDEKTELNKRISSMPATQQEVLRLSRDVESGRTVFMQLLNRQQELSIAKSSAIGNVRIIDNAVTQPKPVKPKKPLSIVIGFILGGMISIAIVLIRVFLRRGIESPEQLEEIGINVYASIPMSEYLAKNRKNKVVRNNKKEEYDSFLAIDNPADLAIEAIRGLRTSLHFAMMEARNNVLMISGPCQNTGKTFVSTNLAAITAQAGKKVLFIDSDMRKGYVHKLFNVSNDNGLSDILSGRIPVEKGIKNISSIGIDLISRGVIPPNPAELLMHARFGELINWASENYDLVIVDTPPVLAVTDPVIIGSYAGTTLLVIRYEENTIKECDVSIKRFERSGVVVKGCIFNGVLKKSSSYYAYGYNHYGYEYSDKK